MKSKRAAKKSSPRAGARVLVNPAYLAKLEAASRAREAERAPRGPGRRPVADPRRPSHVPLNSEEKKKLHGAAEAAGMPYATWARGTLLVVADWPANAQPIRLGSACRGGGVVGAAIEVALKRGDVAEVGVQAAPVDEEAGS